MTYTREDLDRMHAAANIIVPAEEDQDPNERDLALQQLVTRSVRAGRMPSELERLADDIARNEARDIDIEVRTGRLPVWCDRGVLAWVKSRNLSLEDPQRGAV